MSDGGKGSKQRPTDKKKYNENYDKIFGKKKEEKRMRGWHSGCVLAFQAS